MQAEEFTGNYKMRNGETIVVAKGVARRNGDFLMYDEKGNCIEVMSVLRVSRNLGASEKSEFDLMNSKDNQAERT